MRHHRSVKVLLFATLTSWLIAQFPRGLDKDLYNSNQNIKDLNVPGAGLDRGEGEGEKTWLIMVLRQCLACNILVSPATFSSGFWFCKIQFFGCCLWIGEPVGDLNILYSFHWLIESVNKLELRKIKRQAQEAFQKGQPDNSLKSFSRQIFLCPGRDRSKQ